MDTEMIVISCM